MFHRHSGFSTAYVGSSNLTHSAQVTGLEWNVRVSARPEPRRARQVRRGLRQLLGERRLRPVRPDEFDDGAATAGGTDRGPQVILSPIELRPFPFQERLLELIELSRQRGHHRNLLVAATGTGKTVMAALDYGRARDSDSPGRGCCSSPTARRSSTRAWPRSATRSAMPSFGEKWVGGSRPTRFDHVFASIQSLSAGDLDALPADHFDVVIVDEFHHAAAASYSRLLDHLDPVELLGLTATPERSDGLPILHWFDDRIAAELRLWDAIDQQHLSPFLYFGIHDGLDLRDIPWRRGRGYDVEALSNAYTSSDAWARLVVQQVAEHAEPATMRCLGFCVEHRARPVHGRALQPPRHRRRSRCGATAREPSARPRCAIWPHGRVRVVFSVDLFNEGVDVPAVDTVLMLRPTESPTLFLQQLGRGLRKTTGKTFCTVLDFVGTHRKEFRFDRRYRALLGGTRRDVERAVQQQFPFLPAGCHMQLDAEGDARSSCAASARRSRPDGRRRSTSCARCAANGPTSTSPASCDESGLDLDDVYDGGKSWSDLREAAGAPVLAGRARRAGRCAGRSAGCCTSTTRSASTRTAGSSPRSTRRRSTTLPDAGAAPAAHARRRQSPIGRSRKRHDAPGGRRPALGPPAGARRAARVVRRARRADRPRPRAAHAPIPTCPLQVHARYSRIEILAAIGLGDRRQDRRLAERRLRGEGRRTPSCSPSRWTRAAAASRRRPATATTPSAARSSTGRASRSPAPTARPACATATTSATGRSILLFTRLRADDRAFWFLGPATYRGHVGERPMAITWELRPAPGDLYASVRCRRGVNGVHERPPPARSAVAGRCRRAPPFNP